MKMISSLSALEIAQDSRVLVFMPHPDDEAVLMSGLLKKLTHEHILVRLVVLTAGEASTLRYGLKPDQNLAEARKKEQARACQVLGLTDYVIANFHDGDLKNSKKDLKKFVAAQIRDFYPTLVVTLEPDGIYGHPDHITLTDVVETVTVLPTRLLYVTIAKFKVLPSSLHMAEKAVIRPIAPQFCLKLGLVEKITKIRSIRAHKSQFKAARTNSKDFNFFQANGLLGNEYFTYRSQLQSDPF